MKAAERGCERVPEAAMNPSKLFAIASFAAVVGTASSAHASSTMESRFWGTVVWEDRAGTCGTAISVSNLVETNLSGPSDRDPLFVRAEIDRARVGRARASLFLRRGSAIAVRELDAASCDELSRSAAVVITMAYEMGLDPEPSTPPPAPTEEAAAVPTPVPARAPEAPPAADKRESAPPKEIRFYAPRALSFAPIADVGTLPNPAGGVRGRFARDFGIIGVAFTGIFLTGASQTNNDVTFDVSYAAGGLQLFRSWTASRFTFELGVGLSLGQYWIDAGSAPITREGKPPYAALEASFDTTYRLTDAFRMRAGIGNVVHANRAAYSSNDRSVWDPAGMAYRVSIGPELVF